MALKIAIVNLTSGGLSGGYLKYLRALVPLLRTDRRVDRVEVFLPAGVDVPECGPTRSFPARHPLTVRQMLRRELDVLAPDVVFFPTARLLDCGRVPTVVMVRNMEPLSVPFAGNTWRESFRNVARARTARHACRRASRVLAVSRHVYEFVNNRWGVPPERLGLVYHGIDPATGPARDLRRFEQLQPFVFTAGSIRPARGLEDLIQAAGALRSGHPGLKFVIAGSSDSSSRPYEARMRRLVEQLGLAEAVVWAGHLPPDDMAAAFQRCAAFVMTSRAEACPNVALEALSHGAPIVSTLQAPMPEFFADAATYYEPRDARTLASRVTEVLRLPSGELSRRRAAALRRAAGFTWSRTADETVAQLQLATLAAGTR